MSLRSSHSLSWAAQAFACVCTAILVASGPAGLHAQERQFDPNNSVKFNLPADSPVSLLSWDVNQSSATMRGGALTLDVHIDLSLRNAGPGRLLAAVLGQGESVRQLAYRLYTLQTVTRLMDGERPGLPIWAMLAAAFVVAAASVFVTAKVVPRDDRGAGLAPSA